jgi:hypothetical protein
MKTHLTSAIMLVIAALCFTSAAYSMDAQDMDKMEHFGTQFHTSTSNGYTLAYYLMDLRKMDNQDTQKQMDKPHHIMVYITDQDNTPVLKAKVGFMIKGGAKGSQKAMAMAMGTGFGTTADMKQKGEYTIITKALIGQEAVMDTFTYEMK